MDIYEYAMQMEKDGEAYYRDLAGKTSHQGLKSILGMLADAEVKHYKLFEDMKQHEKVGISGTTILDDVKNIFIKIREENQRNIDLAEVALYKKAQDIEKKSRDFYLDKSGQVDPAQREIFLKIADEEKRHFLILEKLIDFVSRPDYWLENPEWYHLEDY